MPQIGLIFCWSALIVNSAAKLLRSKVSGPQVRAYLNAADFENHKGSLVVSTGGSQPEVLLGGHHHDIDAESPAVCEEEVDATCARRSCETGEPCATAGRISRMSHSNVPSIAGNAPGSYCAVSEQYKFIFVHILKNAGSSTKSWLRDAVSCGEDQNSCLVEDLDCRSAMLAHPDFFRWTWSRHPFDRALSIYGMAKHYHMDASISFADFWLSGDRWAKTSLSPDHAKPQANFVLDLQGCLAVDYVARLDNATAEWPHILDMLGWDALKAYQKQVPFMQPEEGNVFGKLEAADEGAANGQDLVEQDPALKAALLEEFKPDFDLFF